MGLTKEQMSDVFAVGGLKHTLEFCRKRFPDVGEDKMYVDAIRDYYARVIDREFMKDFLGEYCKDLERYL